MKPGDLVIAVVEGSAAWYPKMGNKRVLMPRGTIGVVVSDRGRYTRVLFRDRVYSISPHDFRVVDDEE